MLWELNFHLQTPEITRVSHVAIINAWIKFSAARFCSSVPDIRAIRSPRADLFSEISTVAPEIWIKTTRHKTEIR